SISGYDGHAFVFAQVTTPNSVSPAPTGTTHQSPYYAEWARVAIGSTTCPWVWAVYVFNRTTNLQVNPTPPNAPSPDFGTTTMANGGPTTLRLAHTYQAAGQYDARVIAYISGHAQAAVYDRYGRPQLIQQAFSVQVGNHAVASTRARAIKRYLSPAGQVTVVP